MTETRKEQILIKAAEVMQANGYHGASMQEIADNCGLHKASLYHYFKSKDEILDQIFASGFKSFLPGLEDIVMSDLKPKEKLRQAIGHHLNTLCDNLPFASVMLQEVRTRPDSRSAPDGRGRYEELFKAILQQGIDAGDFREAPVSPTVLALLGMLNWAFQWYSPAGPLQPSEIADIFWKLIYEGLNPQWQTAS